MKENVKGELKEIYQALLNDYGKQGWWPLNGKYSGKLKLNEEERFEICLGAILTQNTSWKNVENVLDNLRNNNLLNKNKLKMINIKKLAELIKSSGYNNQKAKKIKEFIKATIKYLLALKRYFHQVFQSYASVPVQTLIPDSLRRRENQSLTTLILILYHHGRLFPLLPSRATLMKALR